MKSIWKSRVQKHRSEMADPRTASLLLELHVNAMIAIRFADIFGPTGIRSPMHFVRVVLFGSPRLLRSIAPYQLEDYRELPQV